MTLQEAHQRLDRLIARNGGVGPELIGILIVGIDDGVALSMDSADDTDITMLGISARRKAGPVVADIPLERVTPTLERPR